MHGMKADESEFVRLSAADAVRRRTLLDRYRVDVYEPAFPDEEIREDPGYWLGLLESDRWPDPPQPLLEVILALRGERILGGVTIELYRGAQVGFLTYISVAAEARGEGIGRRLVAAARAWLDENGGPDVPMLAETERFEDAGDEEERAATILRQRRLAGLGARLLDFDYIMPPLRPGLQPHPLHMMVFGEPSALSGARVLGLLTELAHALETDLADFDDTRAMAAALAADRPLALLPLPKGGAVPDRRFTEAPIFTDLDATSFTFAFELEYSARTPPAPEIEDSGEEQEIDHSLRAAFRLRRLNTALAALKNGTSEQQHVFRRLVQPVRSFLDDVTMGPAGSNGRPLLFAASGAHPDAASRRVWLVRPGSWDYEYENEATRLTVTPKQRFVEFRLRDSFCAFESGRIFYLLTLTQEMPPEEDPDEDEGDDGADPVLPPAEPTAIDEYAVLQLQQLVLDKKLDAKRADILGFWPGDRADAGKRPLSLIELAETRLRQLEAGTVPGPNGIRDVIAAFRMHPPQAEVRRMPIGLRHLHRLCLGIECATMLDTAERVRRRFEGEDAVKPARSRKAVVRAEPWVAWEAAYRSGSAGFEPPPHDDEENPFDRTFLAFAGVAQGVPDFPYQDESEIHDSTRPAAHSVESSLYVHPRFVLEVAKSWRSFEQARPTIGTCPYLLLMFMVALHDELIVAEMEEQIDDMVYAADVDAEGDGDYRVSPMHDVLDALAKADQVGDRGINILKSNLTRRFELFRWASIQRSGNIFRYPKERGALIAIQKAMGTDARFDRAHQIVDRMESLIEDVNRLKSGYADQRAAKADDEAKEADRRTQRLLFGIAVLGVVSVSADIAGQFDTYRLWIFFGALAFLSIAIVIAAWLLIWRQGPKGRA